MSIKATSKVERFRTEKALWDACIFYKKGTVAFFTMDTIVDPSNYIPMLHSTLIKEANKGRYRIEGKMPDGFHEKLVRAIKIHPTIEPKQKKIILECINEAL